jgi:hypothetical protein
MGSDSIVVLSGGNLVLSEQPILDLPPRMHEREELASARPRKI